MTVVINGKFTAQRITGVQRVARELVRAVNARCNAERLDPLVLLVPGQPEVADLAVLGPYRSLQALSGLLGENLWEQITLPSATRDEEVLFSMCNTGPLFKRQQVVMIHDMAIFDMPGCFTWKFRLWYRVVFAILSRRALHFVTVSEFSRQRIMHHLGLPAERISLIRPAVDHMQRIAPDETILQRFDLQPQGFCLMVGSLDPRKNMLRCLAAIEQVDGPPGFKFILAGGSNTRIFEALPSSGGTVYSRTLQTGFVSDGELKALYENAACFVFPSLYEGFGLPPLEAMYCGCPVIASQTASLPEACGDAVLYCDASSIDDIAAKITQMSHDPALRAHYRERGLAHTHAHDWQHAAHQLESVLHRFAVPGATNGPVPDPVPHAQVRSGQVRERGDIMERPVDPPAARSSR